MKTFKNNNKKYIKDLENSIDIYNEQYKKAIIFLIDRPNFEETLVPLINLIFQYTENYLKWILQDYYELEKTSNESKLMTHKCEYLLNLIVKKFSKYREGTTFKYTIDSIRNYILYIKSFMGEQILINSRYPIQSNKLKKSYRSLNINKQKFDEKTKELMLSLNRLNTYYAFEKIFSTWLDAKQDIEKEKEIFEIELINETEDFFIIEEIYNCNNIVKEN